MIDFSQSDYSCDNQMTFEECLQEMDFYKWETGQYMNLPETEDLHNEQHKHHRLYPDRI